jgi:type IV secretion system protein VirD4
MSQGASLYKLPNSTRAYRRALAFSALVAVCMAIALCLCVAASRVAVLTHFTPELGPPITAPPQTILRIPVLLAVGLGLMCLLLFRRWRYLLAAALLALGVTLITAYPLYPPSAYFLARRAFTNGPFESILLNADCWAIATGLSLAAAVLPFARQAVLSLVRTGDLHGSARQATAADILTAGFVIDDPSKFLSQSSGLPLGMIPYKGGSGLVRAKGDVHALIFAPPGSGKTTGLVIPTTMDWEGSLFALDVKGEIARATAGYRKQKGSRILLLDPSRNDPSLVRYNPLLSIRQWPYDVQDVTEIAQLLVPEPPQADPFWTKTARTLLEGLILHVLYAEPDKTLAACYQFLCSPDFSLDEQFERMLATEHEPSALHGWTRHPRVQMAAKAMLDMPAQTRGGVVSNAQASLSPYADPILAQATATSDFRLEDLYAASGSPTSLYLVIDPNSLQRLADHIRIVVSQITAALTRQMPSQAPRHPFLLILDEFPVFGRMRVLETALAYLRGYGVQAYLVVQHVGQLRAAYGANESISPNCSVHVAFAPADLETAKSLSQRSGSQTVHYERASSTNRSTSIQEADIGRPLWTSDEVMRLPKGEALVLRTGTLPFIVKPRPFFVDPLRAAAARIELPFSEPTNPDFSAWLSRTTPPRPVPGSRERRTSTFSKLINPEERQR